MNVVKVPSVLVRLPLAIFALAMLSAGCDQGASGSIAPIDEGSIRPNGSRKIIVGFGDGTPSTAAGAAAQPTEHDPGMMARAADDGEGPSLVWNAPGAWKQTQPSSGMRLAQYAIPRAQGDGEDGELAIFHLGNSGSGVVDETFKRWQSSFDEEAIKGAKRSERKAGGMDVAVLEVSGKYRADLAMMAPDSGATAAERQGMALLGAIVLAPNGAYYFKLLGPTKTVAAAREDFLKLLDSCKLGS